MQTITQLLVNSIRKASKLLQRDFCELEMLQTSNRSTLEFCNKSYQRTKAVLVDELKKISEVVLFSDEQVAIPNKANTVLLINPIDSLINLSKSIPFFGTTITYLKKIDQKLMHLCSVIYFPITGDVYYTNKGGGAWLDKSLHISTYTVRLRVSSQSILENAIIVTDDCASDMSSLTKHILNFGSNSYSLALFVSGKVDLLYFNNPLDLASKYALDLFVKESGGFILPAPNNTILVSNYNLDKKLKNFLDTSCI